MGYSGDQKKQYQLEWITKRRQDWIDENGPCVDCGSRLNLEVDHVNPNVKNFEIRDIWSRRAEIRLVELAKCVVRCKSCHLIKSITDWASQKRNFGSNSSSAKLTDEQVDLIRHKYANEVTSIRKLANEFNVGRNAIHKIVTNKSWK